MPSSYNLRKRLITENESTINYQKHKLESKETEYLNLHPQVYLRRIKVLENVHNHDKQFRISNGKIVQAESHRWYAFSGKPFAYYVLITTIMLVLILYLKGESLQIDTVQLKFKHLCTILTNFMVKTHQFYISYLKKDQKILNKCEEVKAKQAVVIEKKKSKVKSQVREILNEQFQLLETKNNHLEAEPTPFIKEECQKQSHSIPFYQNKPESILLDEKCSDFSILTDYALESRGAKVLSTFDTEPYGVISLKFWNYDFELQNYFFQSYLKSKGPAAILIPSKKPGDCWAFKGTRGRIMIELSDEIVINAVTIDHITDQMKSRNGSILSAPKKFSVVGIIQNNHHLYERFPLGSFEFKLTGSPMQTFTVNKFTKPFKIIEINFTSNHGNKAYTCVYKIRFHGNK